MSAPTEPDLADKIAKLVSKADEARDQQSWHEEEAADYESRAHRLDAEIQDLEAEQDKADEAANAKRYEHLVGAHSPVFASRAMSVCGHGQHWISNGHIAVRLDAKPDTDESVPESRAAAGILWFNEGWHPAAGEPEPDGDAVRFGGLAFDRSYVALAMDRSEALHLKSGEDHGVLFGADADGENVVVIMGKRS